MPTLLVRNARLVVTMDAQRREIADGGVFVRDHVIEAVGASVELPRSADEVIDARDQVVIPGLVNTHHHMYQTLTRVVRAAQDCELFDWLRALYPIWAGMTPEMVQVSTQVAMAELLLSGCTTSSDHLYLFPNGVRLEGEARLALLLQRVAHGPIKGPSALTAREVLEIATLGGARVLNRDDIGALAPGMSADLVSFPLDEIGLAGAHHDPLAALFFCHVPRVTHSIVHGRVLVRDGQLATLELPPLIERHNRLARQLMEAAA